MGADDERSGTWRAERGTTPGLAQAMAQRECRADHLRPVAGPLRLRPGSPRGGAGIGAARRPAGRHSHLLGRRGRARSGRHPGRRGPPGGALRTRLPTAAGGHSRCPAAACRQGPRPPLRRAHHRHRRRPQRLGRRRAFCPRHLTRAGPTGFRHRLGAGPGHRHGGPRGRPGKRHGGRAGRRHRRRLPGRERGALRHHRRAGRRHRRTARGQTAPGAPFSQPQPAHLGALIGRAGGRGGAQVGIVDHRPHGAGAEPRGLRRAGLAARSAVSRLESADP